MLPPALQNSRPSPGHRVGDYTLIRRLGEGGMGTVWLAEHAVLGRRAAIKLLHDVFASRADTVTRFFNEARAASAIPDHGIVQIFDFGRDAAGTVYLVMELLEGEPLDERLRRNGPFAIECALRLVRQVASSLGAAHARGIVHRDLKPENIFIVRDLEVAGGERTKVLDFGIAKLTDPAGMKTQTSTLMGTPTFMSPEQCRGAGNVDQRSDIYSLGCVLFVLLTGRPPFDAEGPGDVIAMHLREPAPLLSSIQTAIPRELDGLVARCLAKDPKQRFANGLALAAAIEALLAALAEPRSSTRTDLSSPMRGVTAHGVAETMMKRPTTLSSGAAELAVAPSSRSRRESCPLPVEARRASQRYVVKENVMKRSLVFVLLAACSYPEPNHQRVDAGPSGEIDADPTPDGDGTVTVTVTRVGNGTVVSEPAGIACDPDCTAKFPAGTSITLTATSAQGNQLGGWSGCTGGLSCTFVLASSTAITATFEPLVSPPPRSSHNMVWDSIRKRAVMFGGGDAAGGRRDIWEWDGNRWTDRTKATGGPSARYDFAMAFDANRNRVVVFGGLNGSTYNAETWEWDPSTGDWANKTTAGPAARAYTHMTYDPIRQRALLFGGYGGGHLGDTWEWNGTTWTNRAPSSAPVARALGYMTYDTTRGRALLFGGFGGGNRNDSWEWDGTSWVDRTPASVKPPVRNTFHIVHDPVHQVALLYGGYPPAPQPVFADTWIWHGATQTWTNPNPSPNPGPLVGHAMTFDTERGRVLLFGGAGGPALSAETWEWNGTAWKKR